MLSGVPIIYGISPAETETSPSHQLGAIGITSDGRKFRYARVDASTALVAGTLLQGKAENTSDQALAVAATAVGATAVTTTSTVTVDANEYADGYMIVTTSAGIGTMYQIKSHPAATAAVVTLTLREPIRVALTTGSRIDLVANPYNRVIINPTTATSAPVGVAFVAAAVDTYTWIQVGGPASVLNDGGSTVGTNVSASNGTPGAVEAAVTAQAAVGYAMSGIATAENGAIFLTIN